MAEGQGEALATIGEIAQGHGDIRAAVRTASRTPFEQLLHAWLDEVDDVVTWRPYSASVVGLAAGLLGGLAIAWSARKARRRSW